MLRRIVLKLLNRLQFTLFKTKTQSRNICFFLSFLSCISNFCAYGAELKEAVTACVIPYNAPLTPLLRAHVAQCLGWQPRPQALVCQGYYQPIVLQPLVYEDEINIKALRTSLYLQGRSTLSGQVEVQQHNRMVSAETAYIYRDARAKQITHIKLLGEVTYLEPERLMIARQAEIDPRDKSGKVFDVIYRFNAPRAAAILPSWGQAARIDRLKDKRYILHQATYSTCAPQDNAWHIRADYLSLDELHNTGIAKHAKLYLKSYPVLYLPYLNFPVTKQRKSGFLIPTIGSSNIGGFDVSLPYYMNLAPNFDATFTPHLYSKRGLMLGGEFRYLNQQSFSQLNVQALPQDNAYKHFLAENTHLYPKLQHESTNRWSLHVTNLTRVTPDLRFRLNYQQVSDNYFLQDFSSNFAILTERQLLREAELVYNLPNWTIRGLLQGYQTLQPVNEPRLDDIYKRLPQIAALGNYDDLPWNANLAIESQFDKFVWTKHAALVPEGERFYINPVLSALQSKPWGFINPAIEMVNNYYALHSYHALPRQTLGHAMFRYHVDSGLVFERQANARLTQTLEPRLFYLNVPYYYQTNIPVFDSGYMIFNTDQLFRTNRFSGFDRIGDTHQLSYALTSRFIQDINGVEQANITVGQIYYFNKRRVTLCQKSFGQCQDNPYTLGYLSPNTTWSPVAARLNYQFNPTWHATMDYVWDVNKRATNNAYVDVRYQTAPNKLIGLGYAYLVMGDITDLPATNLSHQVDPLHQITTTFAWPYNDRWSMLGVYNYNLSKHYDMMAVFGVQYDSCCWAFRLLGGRTFQSLSPYAHPQYNNHIYLQIQLKGIGAAGSSAPTSIISTFLPGYVDSFHR